MELKVGDKVRIVKFPEKSCIGMVCEVISIEQDGFNYCCRIKEVSTRWSCLMLPDEIEKVNTKNQQLLFSFMSAMEGT